MAMERGRERGREMRALHHVAPLQVHYNLFAGSVLAVGNEDQVKQLDEIQQKAFPVIDG